MIFSGRGVIRSASHPTPSSIPERSVKRITPTQPIGHLLPISVNAADIGIREHILRRGILKSLWFAE